MARIHGKDGRLYVGLASSTAAAEPVAFLNSWGIDQSTDRTEVTAFDDANKTYVAGKEDTQGTYGGFWDSATAQLYTAASDGAKRRFYLYPDATVGTTGPYWFGEAFFDWSVSGSADGAVEISGSWSAASNIGVQAIT